MPETLRKTTGRNAELFSYQRVYEELPDLSLLELMAVHNKVWNPATGQWDSMVQPTIEITGTVQAEFDQLETLVGMQTDASVILGTGSLNSLLKGLQTQLQGRLQIDDAVLTTKLDYDGTNRLLYRGKAQPGTAAATAGWLIAKYTYDGAGNLTDIQWANGSGAFNTSWTARLTTSYS